MEIFLIVLHVIVCFVLIMVVLLQSGKAADLAGAFGGGGSQTAFGSRGAATVLTRATTVAAVMFMITSLSLAILGSRRGSSVLESAAPPASAPAAPAAGGPPGPAGTEASPAKPGTPAGAPAPKSAAPSSPNGAPAPAVSPAPQEGPSLLSC